MRKYVSAATVATALFLSACGTDTGVSETNEETPSQTQAIGFPSTTVKQIADGTEISFSDIPTAEFNVLWFWAPH